MIKKIFKYLFLFVTVFFTVLTITFYFSLESMAQFGGDVTGDRLEKLKESPNFKNGKFRNTAETESSWSMSETVSFVNHWLFGNEERIPERELPTIAFDSRIFLEAKDDELKIAWLGHATVLIRINGLNILTDPIWSDNPSVSTLVGAKRFHKVPLELSELPKIDVVLISHDHYDHLDMSTVTILSQSGVIFLVPLGVGAHLEEWEIPASQIVEFDWYDSLNMGGDSLMIVATPARHASGRGLVYGSNPTLWSSWVIKSKKHSLFFSGDTGDDESFDEIGRHFGPFDYTFMAIGAYSERWPDIHLTPEQAVDVHRRLGGKVLIPIHWGTFNLSFHDWFEPAERLVEVSEFLETTYHIPMPGEIISSDSVAENSFWWREYVE